MAKTKVSEWSSTASSNTDIDGINIAENCPPSGINDAIRELMSQVKDFQSGTYSDPFNGPVNGTVGATTPAAGAFTTLSASSTATLNTLASSGATLTGGSINNMAIGASTASSGAFTTLAASGAVTLSGGTANGVPYLNGSKVLTTGSALTFDGTNLATTGSVLLNNAQYYNSKTSGGANIRMLGINSGNTAYIGPIDSGPGDTILNASSSSANIQFYASGSEKMRLTSTGLGIGTSSPNAKLAVAGGGIRVNGYSSNSSGDGVNVQIGTTGGVNYLQSLNGTGTNNLSIDANQVTFRTGSYATAATLDSSGNLGLGVTPRSWAAGNKVVDLPYGSFAANSGSSNVWANSYYNGSSFIYSNTGYASFISQSVSTGGMQFYIAPSGTAGNAISFTQAMTLNAIGQLLIGTTSNGGVSDCPLMVSNGGAAGMEFSPTAISGENRLLSYNRSSSAYAGFTLSAADIKFQTGGTERARIDSSGNLLVGTTSAGNYGVTIRGVVSATQANISKTSTTLSSVKHWSFQNDNGEVGSISTNGSATTYSTSSDYRLKNTIAPMTGALAKVAQLKPCTYKWNADGSAGEGFIAHELAEVVPACVTGEKDAVETYTDEEGNEQTRPVYQGIDTSFLVATLTAAIQELNAKVESLQSELNSLKGA